MIFFENAHKYEKRQVYAIRNDEGCFTAMWDGDLFIGSFLKDGAWCYQFFTAAQEVVPCGFSMIGDRIPHIHTTPFIYNAFPSYYKK